MKRAQTAPAPRSKPESHEQSDKGGQLRGLDRADEMAGEHGRQGRERAREAQANRPQKPERPDRPHRGR